jgi:hypothetical protein
MSSARAGAGDLRDMTKHTVTNWGEAQGRAKVAEIEMAAEAVAQGTGFTGT